MKTISAIYEDGVFRPTEPVELPEHATVKLDLHMADEQQINALERIRSIEEEIADIMADVPQEVWREIPRDLSQHIDHYLYGIPKDWTAFLWIPAIGLRSACQMTTGIMPRRQQEAVWEPFRL